MNANNRVVSNVMKIVPDSWIESGKRLILGIERVKRNLAEQAQNNLGLPQRLFQVALNEAEALAWETEYPQLLFPALAEEKIEAISAWYGHGESLNSGYAMAV